MEEYENDWRIGKTVNIDHLHQAGFLVVIYPQSELGGLGARYVEAEVHKFIENLIREHGND